MGRNDTVAHSFVILIYHHRSRLTNGKFNKGSDRSMLTSSKIRNINQVYHFFMYLCGISMQWVCTKGYEEVPVNILYRDDVSCRRQ